MTPARPFFVKPSTLTNRWPGPRQWRGHMSKCHAPWFKVIQRCTRDKNTLPGPRWWACSQRTPRARTSPAMTWAEPMERLELATLSLQCELSLQELTQSLGAVSTPINVGGTLITTERRAGLWTCALLLSFSFFLRSGMRKSM